MARSRVEPGLKAARQRQRELLGRSMTATLVARLAALPLLLLSLLLIVGRLVWAAISIPVFAMYFLTLVTVAGFRRDRRIYRVTVGSYRRAVRAGLPVPVVWEAPFALVPELVVWGGLPPGSRIVSWLLGVAGLVCWGLAVGFAVGFSVGPVVVVVVEVVAAVFGLVAVTWWWRRCDRAVWVYSSRWWRVWVGRVDRMRLVVVGVALLVAVGFVVWAAGLLRVSGVPWLVGWPGCVGSVGVVWGMCVSPEVLGAAVRADAVGNLGILGFGFVVMFLNSLGGVFRGDARLELSAVNAER